MCQSKPKYTRQKSFTENLSAFKASKKGKRERSQDLTSRLRLSTLTAAFNDHLGKSNVMKTLVDFMKIAAEAEQNVTDAEDIFDNTVTVQRRQFATIIMPGKPPWVDANGASSSSDGVMAAPRGRGFRYSSLPFPDASSCCSVVGPNSGEDAAAIARREAAGDAKMAAFDYEADASRKNRDSFTQHEDPKGMRKGLYYEAYEDRLFVDEKNQEVYPGRKRLLSMVEFGTRLTRTKS